MTCNHNLSPRFCISPSFVSLFVCTARRGNDLATGFRMSRRILEEKWHQAHHWDKQQTITIRPFFRRSPYRFGGFTIYSFGFPIAFRVPAIYGHQNLPLSCPRSTHALLSGVTRDVFPLPQSRARVRIGRRYANLHSRVFRPSPCLE